LLPIATPSRLGRALLFCSCLLSALTAGVTSAATIDPADPNLLYTGRWDDFDASRPWAQAKGSSLIARFEGTSFAVTLTTQSTEYYRIIVDGDAWGSTKVTLPSGVSTTLASGLTAGIHQIELVKETDLGRMTLLSLELDDGSTLVAPPARPARRIVFYGDSNLAGYSLESERNQGGSSLQGSYYTYAGITARMFAAEYHNISKSGATIASLNRSFDRIDWNSRNPAWSFSRFPADAVVVNIGANDIYVGSKATIKSRYHSLLDELRMAHPDSHIVLYNAYGWDVREPASYTHEVVAERADANLTSAVFPWVFEQFHGCETDHAGMAVYLSMHLGSVLGWAANPPDVVSGYGLDGDVANGSFEERAPFGGWGWRYFDDPGVARIYDPGGAHHGDYYLRLRDGAASQQTNPSYDGDVRSLDVWMRGASAGAEVAITIDFRDQQAGAAISDPIVAQTETRVLTTEWQRYVMTATAPTSPLTPVYASRLRFQAGPGDTVEIDRVSFAPPPACSDGVDNDGDGFIDHPADPGCFDATSDREAPQCQDGIDNDGLPGTDFDGGESVLGAENGDPNGPDPQCTHAWRNREAAPSGCGLGAELALVLSGLALWRRHRSARNAI
jgi:lysophospholipase L1-like esterase